MTMADKGAYDGNYLCDDCCAYLHNDLVTSIDEVEEYYKGGFVFKELAIKLDIGEYADKNYDTTYPVFGKDYHVLGDNKTWRNYTLYNNNAYENSHPDIIFFRGKNYHKKDTENIFYDKKNKEYICKHSAKYKKLSLVY